MTGVCIHVAGDMHEDYKLTHVDVMLDVSSSVFKHSIHIKIEALYINC